MQGVNVVITGVCGLVGSRLASSLSAAGCQVFGVDLPERCSQVANCLSGYASIDLSSEDAVEKLKRLVATNVDVVIHCAAQQPRPNLSLSAYQGGNVISTEHVGSWASDSGVKVIISFSTVVFLDLPLSPDVKVDELSSVKPTNFYSLSKYCAETYLEMLGRNSNLKIFCLRIPSLVHEEQNGGLVHTFWKSARENKDIDIYDNGQFKRSLIHIESIVEMIVKLIRETPNVGNFKLYNLATKDSWTLSEIADYIYKETCSIANVVPVSKPGQLCGHWNIDISKAELELGFDAWSTKKTLDVYINNM